jgi:hypothetical protein
VWPANDTTRCSFHWTSEFLMFHRAPTGAEARLFLTAILGVPYSIGKRLSASALLLSHGLKSPLGRNDVTAATRVSLRPVRIGFLSISPEILPFFDRRRRVHLVKHRGVLSGACPKPNCRIFLLCAAGPWAGGRQAQQTLIPSRREHRALHDRRYCIISSHRKNFVLSISWQIPNQAVQELPS